MKTQLSLRDLMDQLKAENLLSPDVNENLASILTQEHVVPWAVNILMGLGIWLATLLFLGFMLLALTLKDPMLVVVGGSVLVATAILLNKLSKESLVLDQFALAFSLTGQILLSIGLSEMPIHKAWVALFIFVLAVILFIIYQHQVHRFLTVLIAVSAALFLLQSLNLEQGLPLLIFAIAGGAVWCWLEEASCLVRLPTLQRPLGYGLAVALLGLVSPSLPFLREFFYTNWTFVTLGLTGLLLFVIYHNLRLYRVAITTPSSLIIFASTLLVSGLLYQAPGVIAAVIVILLGFQRNNRFLMGLAFIFFLLFYISYYYYLDVTLLMKSITLMSAGVILLGLRFGLKPIYFDTSINTVNNP